MSKLINILLIGLLLFFSDINAIKIKKNYLKLSSKKTHKSKGSNLTPLEQKRLDCERKILYDAVNVYRPIMANIGRWIDPNDYAKRMAKVAEEARVTCEKKIEKEEKEKEEKEKEEKEKEEKD